jgi:hypothetical protein
MYQVKEDECLTPNACEIKGVSGTSAAIEGGRSRGVTDRPASPRRTVMNSEADLPSQLEEVFRL